MDLQTHNDLTERLARLAARVDELGSRLDGRIDGLTGRLDHWLYEVGERQGQLATQIAELKRELERHSDLARRVMRLEDRLFASAAKASLP